MKTLPKARILVTRFPYESRFGGEEVHTLRLMEELDDRGHEAFFLGSCPVLLREFKNRGFSTKRAWLGKPPVTKGWLLLFTLLSPILFLKAGLMLGRTRKKWGVDTVYMLSFGEKLLMTPWARLFGMKVLWLEHARIGKWLTKNPWWRIYRQWSAWATVVVTSRAMLRFVEPWAKKVVAISCAVMPSEARPLPKEIVEFLKGGFSIGSVARLTADKGVDILVHLVDSKPDVRLIIVGEGPLRGVLEKKLAGGQIMLVPSLSRGQLTSFYRALDLFVLASTKFDPFGMVAAEAMSVGTPVLMTNVCGISEDLVADRDALIVEPSRSELDKALKKVLRHPELLRELGEHGRQFVEKHYRLETMVALFEGLLW
ncbi:MAG: glycosyltransferase family 4 protein [Candidatus Gracilibacteria bacterium]